MTRGRTRGRSWAGWLAASLTALTIGVLVQPAGAEPDSSSTTPSTEPPAPSTSSPITTPSSSSTAPGSTTTSQGSTTTTPKRLKQCVGDDCFDTRISGLVNVASPGVRLDRTYVDSHPPNKLCAVPQSDGVTPLVIGPATKTWCYEDTENHDSRIVFYYRIGQWEPQKNAWTTLPYYMDGYALVPWWSGSNESSCTIRVVGTNAETTDSPFTCSVTWGDPSNRTDPQPHWTLKVKPVHVIDAKTASPDELELARNEILDTCAKGKPTCTYQDTEQHIFAPPQAEWVPYGSLDANPTDKSKPYEVDTTVKFSWKSQWRVSAEVDLATLNKIFTAKLKGEFGHEWAEEQSWSEKHHMDIDPHHVGGFYLQEGKLEMTGNFQIVYPDHVDQIENYSVVWPLRQDYNPPNDLPIVHTGIIWPVQWPCEKSNKACYPSGGTLGALPPGAQIGRPLIAEPQQ